jgi:hypothetical protein
VSTDAEVRAAISRAVAGDVIRLAPGAYAPLDIVDASGTEAAPITLCGPRDAVVTAPSTGTGYAVHLTSVSHWRLRGFSVRGGLKGVVLDDTDATTIAELSIEGTGDEALHVRDGSTDALLLRNEIARTGLEHPDFGEGIYVGTAISNWCEISACRPDRSDGALIVGNTVSETTAEAIDIKEGTHRGTVESNSLDGSGATAVDSVIDVKGTGWRIAGNDIVGARSDGVQVHVIEGAEGSGEENVIVANTVALDSRSGWAVQAVGAAREFTKVGCDNVATIGGAAEPSRRSADGCSG